MTFSRRDLCLLIGALAASPGVALPDTRLTGKAYPYADLPVHESNGHQSRPILAGELHNGQYLEVHETRLPPGGMPHPPHHHVHEEMFLIREGTLEVTINGESTRLGRAPSASPVRTNNTASATSERPPPNTLSWRWARTLESADFSDYTDFKE